jgi:hypothetical protein
MLKVPETGLSSLTGFMRWMRTAIDEKTVTAVNNRLSGRSKKGATSGQGTANLIILPENQKAMLGMKDSHIKDEIAYIFSLQTQIDAGVRTLVLNFERALFETKTSSDGNGKRGSSKTYTTLNTYLEVSWEVPDGFEF